MADFNPANVSPLPFIAGGTIAINRFVKQDTSRDRGVLQGAAGTDKTFGVAMEAATIGLPVAIQGFGIAKVTAGAAVVKGAQVTSDANGKAVTVATSDNPAGVALTAAGADLDVIEVYLHGGVNVTGPTTP